MNLQTILLALVILGIFAAIVVKMIRDKKNHKSGCSCGCDGCPGSSVCHGKTDK